MTSVISFTIGPEDGWQRLDAFLGKALEGRMSREKVKKAVQEGRVSLNGKPCTVPKTKVGPGDAVGIELPAPAQGPQPEAGALEILYRDADLAVINKPANLTVHPCPSCPSGTLVNRLLAHFPELAGLRDSQAACRNSGEDDDSVAERDFASLAGDDFPEDDLEDGVIDPLEDYPEDYQADAGYDEDDEAGLETYGAGCAENDWALAPEAAERLPVGAPGGYGYSDDSVFFAQDGDRPGIVHRLDKDTTGLLLVALNEPARLRLAGDFASRRVKKEYLALVYGVPEEAQGRIDVPIGRDPENKTRMKAFATRDGRHLPGGREALSDYRLLYADPEGRFSLLAVRIHTGRTHQIRVHLRFIGHPIIGDAAYFDFNAAKPLFNDLAGGKINSRAELAAFFSRVASRPLLHAWRVSFEHPQCLEDFSEKTPPEAAAALERGALEAEEGGLEMAFCCPPPDDFLHAVRELSRRMQRVVLTGNSGCGKSSVLAKLVLPVMPVMADSPDNLDASAALSAPNNLSEMAGGNATCDAQAQATLHAGIPVWSADKAVSATYDIGGDGWHMLRSAFGGRFVPDENSPVNKKVLFESMFNDEALRRDIERIVHPIADRSMRDFFRQHDFWANPAAWPLVDAQARDAAASCSSGAISGCPRLGGNACSGNHASGGSRQPGGEEAETARPACPFLPELQPALAVAEVPLYFESVHLDKGAARERHKGMHGRLAVKAAGEFETPGCRSGEPDGEPCGEHATGGHGGASRLVAKDGAFRRSGLVSGFERLEAGAGLGRASAAPDFERLGSDTRPLVVGVHCPRALRVQRLKNSRNWPDSMIEKMESWQWPEEKKMLACDLVLDNSGGLADLEAGVRVLLKELERLRERRLEEIVGVVRGLCACE